MNNFKTKHISNFLVRLLTFDMYYVCEECNKIHKRDGKEIRLDEPRENLIHCHWWYGSVCRKSYTELFNRIRQLIRDENTWSD